MWPHQSQNYCIDREREDSMVESEQSVFEHSESEQSESEQFESEQSESEHFESEQSESERFESGQSESEQLDTVSDEDHFVYYGSGSELPSMGFYTAAEPTPASNFRCDCSQELTVLEQEMVIRNSLSPHHLPYYSSSLNTEPARHRSIDVAPSTQQSSDSNEDNSESLMEIILPNRFQRNSEPPCVLFVENRLSSEPTDELSSPNRLLCPMANRQRMQHLAGMPMPDPLAVQVANRVINYARGIKNASEKDVCCLDCGFIPHIPVTGPCGHTRCAKCIQDKGKCPCGNVPPQMLHVNVLLQEIIGRTAVDRTRIVTPASSRLAIGDQTLPSVRSPDCDSDVNGECMRVSRAGPIRSRKHKASSQFRGSRRTLMSPRARYDYAIELMAAKRYAEATPHLALAAASCLPELRMARSLLAQVITVRSKGRDPRRLNRDLNRSIRHMSTASWIKLEDMECVLCCDTYTNPVTTPCGHTFCRICIERTLDYGKRCPLCLRSLQFFNLRETRETAFVQAALAAVNAVNATPPPEPDTIPIFLCTVAFPSVPCPLFIFDPRYWLMIRRVLESGSRKFGMVACDRDCRYASYGTILEVRDCVHLEDGRSILSTVGISRFSVTDVFIRDGCEVARIMPISDVQPRDSTAIFDLKIKASKVLLKTLLWLKRINVKVLMDIETTFGSLPNNDWDDEWWESRDGPGWLWWLVAVLPLRTEIKVLILSTDCLLKRLMAVGRTLEALASAASAPTA